MLDPGQITFELPTSTVEMHTPLDTTIPLIG